jgi:signal recognition particle subunit SRP54
MFQSLSDRLSGILDKLTRRGALTESDVAEAMREVRRALLEADVALDVVKSFVDRVKAKAVGVEVVKSVTPGQMVVKIVHDELVATLGSEADPIDLAATPPVAILMVGLQGSGKTTTTAKIAHRLTNRDKKRVLMASLDTRRPAAQEQLRVLGEQTSVTTLPIIAGQTPVDIAHRAVEAARLGGYDVVLLDTAGRVTIDDELMAEVAAVKLSTNPHETLLVADALTGQDAVNTAKAFDQALGITGIVLTRVDGDGRGGAALSMRAVTGKPIKLVGVGEKWDALEDFHPGRIAGRILGMGDIVSLVEKAAQTIDAEKAEKIAAKMKKGEFDFDDLAEQIKQMQKLGGMGGVLGMMPGVAKIKNQIAEANLDDRILKRQHAIIMSMTKKERRSPKVLDGKRKRRIAAGSGTKVEEVNRLIKMHRQMADMMKMMGKNKGMMQRMAGAMGFGGGMGGIGGMMGGGGPSPAELEAMQKELARLDPKALESLPAEVKEQLDKVSNPAPSKPAGPMPNLPGLGGGKLPGLGGGGLPGLGGRPIFPFGQGKKK